MCVMYVRFGSTVIYSSYIVDVKEGLPTATK